MTDLTVFAFEGQQVRFVNHVEQPECTASDVHSISGLDTSLAVNGRPDKLSTSLDKHEKATDNDSTSNGSQEIRTIKPASSLPSISREEKPAQNELKLSKLANRFWAKVDCSAKSLLGIEKECWEWKGSINSTGYGQLTVEKKVINSSAILAVTSWRYS